MDARYTRELSSYLSTKRRKTGALIFAAALLVFQASSYETGVGASAAAAVAVLAVLWDRWASRRTLASMEDIITDFMDAEFDGEGEVWMCAIDGEHRARLGLVVVSDDEISLWKISTSYRLPLLKIGPLRRTRITFLDQAEASDVDLTVPAGQDRLVIRTDGDGSCWAEISFDAYPFDRFTAAFEEYGEIQDGHTAAAEQDRQ